ncbi:unnamed protein product [Caenorhabditis nigoni]
MNDDKTMQISLLCHKLEGLKKERRHMEYDINEKKESLERNDKKQKEQFEKLKGVLVVLEDENVTYEEQIKTMQKSLRAAKLQKKSAM